MARFLIGGLLGAVLILGTGCASVGVRDAKTAKTGPRELPKHIYVSQFSTKGAVFKVDREGRELERFKAGTAALLQEDLVERMLVLAPARKTPESLPDRGWLIRGKFVRVNQGSRALRTAVGFGAGATKMETKVQIFDLEQSSSAPFLSFNTTGGSNAEPGAVSGIGPLTWFTVVGLGAGGVGNALHGLTEDGERTAREIRNRLVDYCIEKKLVSRKWAETVRFKVDNPRPVGSK